ncbi:MAG TPA: flavin reductase family protein [Aggregatilinea sp.]|uniref:flavin reductase family protein n=1 Tax=Aggregatilinea sp. TaxID=2806333 RepID=UPI002BA83458|nr:flavin reductase family protein [Aggregatilinea sp.]HML20699.1 flavin reductase family protein [Aggregatilinea sp.]
MEWSAEQYKDIMAQWASGVTVVTTTCGSEVHGLTVSSFTSVSLTPPLVLVSIGNELETRTCLEQSGVFAVNLLGTDRIEWGLRFAGMIPGVTDRFAGINWRTAVTGSPILPGVLGWLDCEIRYAYPGGDHTIFVGEVLHGEALRAPGEPLLYYHRQWGKFTRLPGDGE